MVCVGALLCGGCRRPSQPAPTPSAPTAEDTTLRGVWLSFIELDEMLTDADPDSAAAAIAAVMDTCVAQQINTVFFHLRAHGDAYFPSAVWPTATAAAPLVAAGFDPLACAVNEAHQRGLEIHGWINPYRLGDSPTDKAACFMKDGVWYLAPHDAAARQIVLDGVREIVDRYAVDGIHFDDYFYPAGMNPTGESFEDIPPDTDVIAWRQTQVDALVSGVYGLCHQRDKRFGVSPMADIIRCRTEACADVTRWMRTGGYVDYVCPQIYTGFLHQSHPFTTLLTEWTSLPRRDEVALYVGLALYKVGMTHDPYAGTGAAEWVDHTVIPRQIQLATTHADGYVLFRYGHLTK